MRKEKILIIEDDREINHLLVRFLEENGYNVISAFTGIDGLNLGKDPTLDLILLDLMLPYKSGDEVIREIRKFSNIPIIIISAKDLTQVKVDLLYLGADDYITKPFDLDEVLARIQRNIRRSKLSSPMNKPVFIYSYKDIILNTENKSILINEENLILTAKEYEILELLIKNPNKIFSKANLFESVWEEEYYSNDNTLNVHMSKLRKKLNSISPDREYIETVWGLGYRLFQI